MRSRMAGSTMHSYDAGQPIECADSATDAAVTNIWAAAQSARVGRGRSVDRVFQAFPAARGQLDRGREDGDRRAARDVGAEAWLIYAFTTVLWGVWGVHQASAGAAFPTRWSGVWSLTRVRGALAGGASAGDQARPRSIIHG
jgi:hypothetical protein